MGEKVNQFCDEVQGVTTDFVRVETPSNSAKKAKCMNEAMLQAEILKGMQAPAQPAEAGMAAPAGADVMDPTGAGGGNIGTGMVPVPGEQGFSANGQTNIEQTQAVGGQQPPMGGIQ